MKAFLRKQLGKSSWYHNIELLEGIITPGRKNANASIVRKIFDRVNVQGVDCLDIGAMDGFYGVLLSRRNASTVICTDRGNRSAEISLVKMFTNTNFHYYPGLSIIQLRDVVDKVCSGPVGFVNFAGVLYHMLDPFGGLTMIRGLVKKGGIVLIDTPAVLDGQNNSMHLTDSSFYSESTFFVPTLHCMQSMLDFAGLKPIDCAYHHINSKIGNQKLVRVAVACRAVNPVVFDADIADSTKQIIRTNFLERINYPSVFETMGKNLQMTTHNTEIKYLLDGKELTPENEKRINLFDKCTSDKPTAFNESDNILSLEDC